jgi:para-nitrobenzyl esterase
MTVVPLIGLRRALTTTVATTLLLGGVAASADATTGHRPDASVVATDHGWVRGLVSGPVREFRGIPYAAPPVGPLRWAPPSAAASWPGVREATQFAPHCAQPASAFGVASTSEDCLYLNVVAPAGSGGHDRMPVIVWFHGGSLVVGESDDYDPTDLVRDGVVVVTVNYRLGALGFLATSTLAGEQDGHAGNYGLMDQQAALRWVQRDIDRFGGDPRNVTIAGESAGGLSVLSHLASPTARGLFHRAIVQSGTYNRTQVPQATAELFGAAFAGTVGCPNLDLVCLRGVPVPTLLGAQAGLYSPNVDGRVLPMTLDEAFRTGQFNRVPVLNGSNHDEWRLIVAIFNVLTGNPVTPENYSLQFGVPADIAARIVAEYPLANYDSPNLAVGAVGTDNVYACTALAADRWFSSYVPTYAYEFDDPDAPQLFLPPADGFAYGAAHASELQYLFGLRNVAYPSPLHARQRRLAATMHDYWTSFARYGSPNGVATPAWPRFDPVTQRVQSLTPTGPRPRADFAEEHRCDFWESLAG